MSEEKTFENRNICLSLCAVFLCTVLDIGVRIAAASAVDRIAAMASGKNKKPFQIAVETAFTEYQRVIKQFVCNRFRHKLSSWNSDARRLPQSFRKVTVLDRQMHRAQGWG